MAESESDEEAIRLEAASKAVRKHCRKLTISLNKNDVPEHLLEEELIEDETHQLLDPLTRKTQIYHGVLRAVKSNPEAIFKLCRILEKDEVGGAALSRSLQGLNKFIMIIIYQTIKGWQSHNQIICGYHQVILS